MVYISGKIPPVNGVGAGNSTIMGNIGRIYSPVTMSHEWSKVGRLLFMVFFACIGTIMNGFFVAAFFVERTLKKIGKQNIVPLGMFLRLIVTASSFTTIHYTIP